jgi:molecular chaperone HtpG
VKIDKRIDQGIGMTSAEVEKYNQLAFFGAEEFLEKYKDSDKDSAKDSGIMVILVLVFILPLWLLQQ